MLSLQDREWKEFEISAIFEISPGKRLTKSEMKSGSKPFIGATDSNNGITAFVSNSNVSEDENILGVNYNGSVVENFYHPYTCIFSDDVKRFRTKQVEGNKYIYLFLKTVILQQKSKYAYGYKFNEQRMQKQLLLLPVDSTGNPDYDFMEQYIKDREQQIVQDYLNYVNKNLLPPPTLQHR
ncbi:MAG: restriction endonuclease subunit S [Oscillospiraceae bacterium]|nr:restriction endonuclease subunit S [Oscillospiraceae bacterium]